MKITNQSKEFASKILAFCRAESSLAFSLAYLLLIGIGMLFSQQYYQRWGINIFEYAGFSDFLIAPFRNPVVFVFVLISIVLAIGFYILSRYLDLRFPKFARYWNMGIKPGTNAYGIWHTANLVLGMVYYSYLFAWISSEIMAKEKEAHPEKHRIEIYLEGESWKQFLLIGQTESYCLVLDEDSGKIMAINQNAGLRAIRFSPIPD